jgi:hypothetical protein
MMLLRGPGTPWSRMQAARRGLDRIIFAEIDRRASTPGAYIPFGGGQRICIGKRFGQLAGQGRGRSPAFAHVTPHVARTRLSVQPGPT